MHPKLSSRTYTRDRSHHLRLAPYSDPKVANRNVGFRVGDRTRGRFATPAYFPVHGCSPFRGLHVRRERLGPRFLSPTNWEAFCGAGALPVPVSDRLRNDLKGLNRPISSGQSRIYCRPKQLYCRPRPAAHLLTICATTRCTNNRIPSGTWLSGGAHPQLESYLTPRSKYHHGGCFTSPSVELTAPLFFCAPPARAPGWHFTSSN
jgi:hypothetical protein